MNEITDFNPVKSFIHRLCTRKTTNELVLIEENLQGLIHFLNQYLIYLENEDLIYFEGTTCPKMMIRQ